jgi:hypothetical protein
MTLKTKPVLILVPVAAVLLCAGLIGSVVYHRSQKTDEKPSASLPESSPEAFTFFNIGPTTQLTNEIQSYLKDHLGDCGVETKTTIDLKLPDIENYAALFPRLSALNQALNYLPRQRVEHDTLRLTYRYAREKDVPFDVIRLVFSRKQRTPLFFNLYSKRDGAEFIGSIRRKYGVPQTIGQENSPEHALYWRKENALLIISIAKNRIGFNEYHFGIYYLDNIAALAEAEKREREQAEKEKEKTGGLAF